MDIYLFFLLKMITISYIALIHVEANNTYNVLGECNE